MSTTIQELHQLIRIQAPSRVQEIAQVGNVAAHAASLLAAREDERVLVVVDDVNRARWMRDAIRGLIGNEAPSLAEKTTEPEDTPMGRLTITTMPEGIRALMATGPALLGDVEEQLLMRDLRARGHAPQVIRSLMEALRASWAAGNPDAFGSLDAGLDAAGRDLLGMMRVTRSVWPEQLVCMTACEHVASLIANEPPYLGEWPAQWEEADNLTDYVRSGYRSKNLSVRPMFDRVVVESGQAPGVTEALALQAMTPVERLSWGIPLVDATNPSAEREPVIHHVVWPTPTAELDGCAAWLQEKIQHEGTLTAGQVCVIVPNRSWARLAGQALQRRKFTTIQSPRALPLTGDPRDESARTAMRALGKLRLTADDRDGRAWFILASLDGDAGVRGAWANLVDHARAAGLEVDDVFQGMDVNAILGMPQPFDGAEALLTWWNDLRLEAVRLRKLRSWSLLAALGVEGDPTFRAAMDALGDAGTRELLAYLTSTDARASQPLDGDAILIATYADTKGLDRELAFGIAHVDGLLDPSCDAAAIRQAWSHIRGDIIVSGFTYAAPEFAAKAHLTTHRTSEVDGATCAVCLPASVLQELDDMPASTINPQELPLELGY